jgi:hypothetical protein
MVHNDGDPLRVVLTKTALESFPLGERLELPKQSVMKSRLRKQTVSSREKPSQDRCSSSVVMAGVDE